jgi:predicted DCC family thiol-disulfide oxidoreductase YuxK
MKHRILVYDDNCPLCTWYSDLFVKYGFLAKEERIPFSSVEPALLQRIDITKSRNEIPLLDTATGNVVYGIDALLEILGKRFSWIKKTGNTRVINWLLRKLYKFISYNRKIIVAKKCGPGSIDCTPDLNYFYRILFLVTCLAFNTAMLIPLHQFVLSKLPYYNLSLEELQWAHLGLVLSNCLLALRFKPNKAIDYLGQVNMLALTAVLLLTPLLFISTLSLPYEFQTGYLITITIIVFKEYLRRMDYASILLKYKWVASINIACITAFILLLFG